ncbi:MAG: DUF4143 domain-containing protein [Bifidobacteriaceae bacterium]|nr:DUF4143 domain-containing protein [Bifidobacteriaceae bacterium]
MFGEFRGALAEQYVLGQLIAAAGIRPFYWSSETGRAEVDFLVDSPAGTVPIEVKSGVNLRSKSLGVYLAKYRPNTAIRTSPADYRVSLRGSTKLVELPLYAIGQVARYL